MVADTLDIDAPPSVPHCIAKVVQRPVYDEHGNPAGVRHGHIDPFGNFVPAPTFIAAIRAAHAANVEAV